MQSEAKRWTAALVVIGDEILSGRTQDKNVAQVATWLNDQGIRLAEVRIVPDDQGRIADDALRTIERELGATLIARVGRTVTEPKTRFLS